MKGFSLHMCKETSFLNTSFKNSKVLCSFSVMMTIKVFGMRQNLWNLFCFATLVYFSVIIYLHDREATNLHLHSEIIQIERQNRQYYNINLGKGAASLKSVEKRTTTSDDIDFKAMSSEKVGQIDLCSNVGFVVIQDQGSWSIGEALTQYGSLLLLKEHYGHQAAISESMSKALTTLLQEVHLPTYPEAIPCNGSGQTLTSTIGSLNSTMLDHHTVILTDFGKKINITELLKVAGSLKLKKELLEQAQDILEEKVNDYFEKNKRYNVSRPKGLISVHVDRIESFDVSGNSRGWKFPSIFYYGKAIEWLRKHHCHSLFIVMCEEIDWCQKMLDYDDVVYLDTKQISDPVILAVASQCNNSLLSQGDLSLWTALLKKDSERHVYPKGLYTGFKQADKAIEDECHNVTKGMVLESNVKECIQPFVHWTVSRQPDVNVSDDFLATLPRNHLYSLSKDSQQPPWFRFIDRQPIDFCKEVGFMTIQDTGRIGNLMSQYSTLLALSMKHNVPAVITEKMLRALQKLFPYISMPIYSKKGCPNIKEHPVTRKWMCPEVVENKNAIIVSWFDDITVHAYKNQIISKELQFSPDLQQNARTQLQGFKEEFRNSRQKQDTHELIFVSVHVRRTDYALHLSRQDQDGSYLSKLYYKAGMEYFRNKLKSVIFIVLSDDILWCQQNLDDIDVFFTRSPDSAAGDHFSEDMSIAAHCNHSVISYGTFSFWSAFLKPNGITVHPKGYWEMKKVPPQDKSAWIGIEDPCKAINVTNINVEDCKGNAINVKKNPGHWLRKKL